MNQPSIEAYGTWIVTTEGDCEGRSTRQLGTHTGYLDDIAFALADQVYYGLRFEYVDPLLLKSVPPKAAEIAVSIGVVSGSMSGPDRVKYFHKLLRGRDTVVKEGQYYSTVILVSGTSPEAQAIARDKVLAGNAARKLDPEELRALKASLGAA